ncbi:MAG: S-methyl-5-thioribose-1-phosphate isomerase [Firmicutes bacterium]|nr:S-methyl-5-thioribose-1-phosphate isomerase [Bacillota bacterium]
MAISDIAPVSFIGGKLVILDQTKLPGKEERIELKCKEDVWEAINSLRVRGAPAIGITAAYGLYVSMRHELKSVKASGNDFKDKQVFGDILKSCRDYIATARPTVSNLRGALDRVVDAFKNAHPKDVREAAEILLAEADKIRVEDEAACEAIGVNGLKLLKPGMGILTHCNAGALATSGYGTALAPIYMGNERGYMFRVYVDETRPLLQGARLTTWELAKVGIDVTLICDNMASIAMSNGMINAVLVGCTSIAANGDIAAKVGTSALAILAKEYGIPFYVFAPTSTIDFKTLTGEDIEIERRASEEITDMWYLERVIPEGVKCYNPSFDITKAEYITAIITEKGIVRAPYKDGLRENIKGEVTEAEPRVKNTPFSPRREDESSGVGLPDGGEVIEFKDSAAFPGFDDKW